MRKITNFICLIIITFAISACGSNARISQSIDNSLITNETKFNIGNIQGEIDTVPDHFLLAIKGNLKTELKKRNIYSEEVNTNPCTININVSYYRMRSGFNRMMWGVMAGKDGVESDVSIIDSKTKNIIGKSRISTFNVMAVGGMEDIARMHAEKIAQFVSGELQR